MDESRKARHKDHHQQSARVLLEGAEFQLVGSRCADGFSQMAAGPTLRVKTVFLHLLESHKELDEHPRFSTAAQKKRKLRKRHKEMLTVCPPVGQPRDPVTRSGEVLARVVIVPQLDAAQAGGTQNGGEGLEAGQPIIEAVLNREGRTRERADLTPRRGLSFAASLGGFPRAHAAFLVLWGGGGNANQARRRFISRRGHVVPCVKAWPAPFEKRASHGFRQEVRFHSMARPTVILTLALLLGACGFVLQGKGQEAAITNAAGKRAEREAELLADYARKGATRSRSFTERQSFEDAWSASVMPVLSNTVATVPHDVALALQRTPDGLNITAKTPPQSVRFAADATLTSNLTAHSSPLILTLDGQSLWVHDTTEKAIYVLMLPSVPNEFGAFKNTAVKDLRFVGRFQSYLKQGESGTLLVRDVAAVGLGCSNTWMIVATADEEVLRKVCEQEARAFADKEHRELTQANVIRQTAVKAEDARKAREASYAAAHLDELLEPFSKTIKTKEAEYKAQQVRLAEAYAEVERKKAKFHTRELPSNVSEKLYENQADQQKRLRTLEKELVAARLNWRMAVWSFAKYNNPEAKSLTDEWKQIGTSPRTCADEYCERLKSATGIRSYEYQSEYERKYSPYFLSDECPKGEVHSRHIIEGFDDMKYIDTQKLTSLPAVVYKWEYVSEAGLLNVRDIDVLCYKDRFGVWRPCMLIYH